MIQIEILRTERKVWLSKENITKIEKPAYAESGVSYSRLERRRVFVDPNKITVETDIYNGAATDCQSISVGPENIALPDLSKFRPTLSRNVIARLIGHKVTFSIRQTP